MAGVTRDPYEVLGLGAGASQATIEAAYRRLCRRFHPDLNAHPEAESRMKEINAAYEVLVRRRRVATVVDSGVYQPPRGATWSPRRPRSSSVRPGAPVLQVAQTALDLGEPRAGATLLDRIEVRNIGGGLLHGTVSTSVPWLRYTPATFDANRVTVQVFVDTASIPDGLSQSATVGIRTNGGTALVEVRVRARTAPRQPAMALQPESLLLGNLPHGLVTDASVELRNAGGGTLRGSAKTFQPWLRVEPERFVGNAVSITVAVDLRPLASGLDHYSAVELRTNAGVVRLPVQVYVAPRQGWRVSLLLQWRALVASGQLLLRRFTR